MSVENLEKFYTMAFKNPSLAGAIKAAQAAGPGNYMTIVIELGKAYGCNFTAQEAGDWIKAKAAATAKGELNDTELEAVAGGKGDAGSIVAGVFETAAGALTFNTGIIADGVNRIEPGSVKQPSMNPFA